MSNNKVVWFEVVGQDAAALRSFYSGMFDWDFKVMDEMDYGLSERDQTGVPGGVGASPAEGQGWATFYVNTPDIGAAIARASALGGRALGPTHRTPDGGIIATIADPEGHIIGLVQEPSSPSA